MALLPAAADAAAGALGVALLPAACAAGALGTALLPAACAADAFGLESVAVLTAACCGALALPWLSCGSLFLLLSCG